MTASVIQNTNITKYKSKI